MSKRQILSVDNVKEIIASYNDDELDICDRYDYTLLMSNDKIVEILTNKFDGAMILHYGIIYRMGDWIPKKIIYNPDTKQFIECNLFEVVSVLPEIPNIKKKKLERKETLYFLENFDIMMDYVESLPEFDSKTLEAYKTSNKIFDLMEKLENCYVLYYKKRFE